MFSRITITEALALLDSISHGELDRFLLRFGLEQIAPANLGSKTHRVNALIRYFIANPGLLGPGHSNMVLEIIEYLLTGRFSNSYSGKPYNELYPSLANALALDGYRIDSSGKLISILPQTTPIALRQTQVEALLAKHSFTTSSGHLTQALSAHTRGDWAAANAQIRVFVESLFDEIAGRLITTGLGASSHQRKEQLARLTPPFIDPTLNEWDFTSPKGFVQGFWNRLHPSGSHPGLSDEEDCTFRLQTTFIVADRFLKRFDTYP